ncbi:hypothetical protein GCM10010174_88950 [Kutzneria viridogrisea]|uniref:DNA methyltransferase n=1 Tax=Kutzneria viridogrisea TaxID=47990 RepID=UPI001602ACCD
MSAAAATQWNAPDAGTVLDSFAGSGVTGEAAVQSGGNFIGIEANAHYAEVSRQRLTAIAVCRRGRIVNGHRFLGLSRAGRHCSGAAFVLVSSV